MHTHTHTRTRAGLPFLDLSFERLFQCLDVGHVGTILALLLLERKVLVVARHESLLTEVMEAFRALLFPFKWESCYVSPPPRRTNKHHARPDSPINTTFHLTATPSLPFPSLLPPPTHTHHRTQQSKINGRRSPASPSP